MTAEQIETSQGRLDHRPLGGMVFRKALAEGPSSSSKLPVPAKAAACLLFLAFTANAAAIGRNHESKGRLWIIRLFDPHNVSSSLERLRVTREGL